MGGKKITKLAFALDVRTKDEAIKILDSIDQKIIIKIGYSLFIRYGKEITSYVKEKGFELFLDLKLHDIPNTVYNGVKSAIDLEADYLTVHALGGKDMLQKAVEAKQGSNLKLLAVTILTSHDNEYTQFLGSKYSLDQLALKLAILSVETGIDGIVCSTEEVENLKKNIDKQFIAVVPGIRFTQDNKDDQTRTATPVEAKKKGADIIVVGRPILNAEDRNKVINKILEQIK